MDYLNRSASGLAAELWKAIDEAAVEAAREILTGRRFLDIDGPYGAGLTAIETGADDFCRSGEDEAEAVGSRTVSVPMLRKACRLSVRRIQAHRELGQPLDLSPVEDAAEAVARREDALVYYGEEAFGLQGLMNARGGHDLEVSEWSDLEEALEDVLEAANTLDGAGFHGPYAMALSPGLYNNLFRRYEGTDMLQLEHLSRLCELGLHKAPIEGALLVDPHVGDLVVGQDLVTGYTAGDGVHYRLFAMESLTLRLQEPEAICRLRAPAK